MDEHVKKQSFLWRRASSRNGIAVDEKCRPINLVFLIVSFLFIFLLFLHSDAASQDKAPVADQLIGGEFSYVVQTRDSLTGIGARFGVNVGVLASDNSLPPGSFLKTGQQLRMRSARTGQSSG